MDKLKKNGFAIGLGALGVGAIGLLYFLVIGKVMGEKSDLGAVRSDLAGVEKKYKLYNDRKRTKIVPSEKSKLVLEDAGKKWRQAIEEAQQLYESMKEKLNEAHPDYSGLDPTAFKAFYETRVDKHREDYRNRFVLKQGAPGAAEAAPGAVIPAAALEGAAAERPVPAVAAEGAAAPAPAVLPGPEAVAAAAAAARPMGPTDMPQVPLYPRFANDEDVSRAMKELWIVDLIFEALNALKIGGLEKVVFLDRPSLERPAAADTTPREYRLVRFRIEMKAPLGELEPLMGRLLQSDRVPLIVDLVEAKRADGTLVPNMTESKEYQNQAEAEADKDAGRPEPPAQLTIGLSALAYQGPKPAEQAKP